VANEHRIEIRPSTRQAEGADGQRVASPLRCPWRDSVRVVFVELLTFRRDGASEAQTRALVDYLSVLQFVAVGTSESASAPVDIPELRGGVEQAMRFFHSTTTDDRGHFVRMMRAWYEGVALRNAPVWAVCIETLQQHGIMASPLAEGMAVTLYAIADVFSRRLGDGAASPVVAD